MQELLFGRGLAESVRICIANAIENADIFNGITSKKILTSGSLKMKDVFSFEQDDIMDPHFQAILEKFGFHHVTVQDCQQVQFISRTVVRRACNIIAACIVGLGCIAPKVVPVIVIGGSFLKYPRFKFYLERMIDIIKPPSLQMELQFNEQHDEAIIGASLLTATSAIQLVEREQGLRSLPPFLLAECCYQEIEKYLNCP